MSIFSEQFFIRLKDSFIDLDDKISNVSTDVDTDSKITDYMRFGLTWWPIDNVAFKFYGDENLDWLVMLSNNILNLQNEWQGNIFTVQVVHANCKRYLPKIYII